MKPYQHLTTQERYLIAYHLSIDKPSYVYLFINYNEDKVGQLIFEE